MAANSLISLFLFTRLKSLQKRESPTFCDNCQDTFFSWEKYFSGRKLNLSTPECRHIPELDLQSQLQHNQPSKHL